MKIDGGMGAQLNYWSVECAYMEVLSPAKESISDILHRTTVAANGRHS